MKITDNVILITGGGSGIGRGLAEAFHRAGNTVIITGRRAGVLEETVRANPGMIGRVLDVDNPADIESFTNTIQAQFPRLNVLINNAGIMLPENLKSGVTDLPAAEATISTNLLGTLRVTAALLPSLIAQPSATIMTVSSGLAFVPIATNPSYCASKAAIHSWTQSLRYQLRDTSVEVLELVPPYVQTELTGAQQLHDPNAMPLEDFVKEVMDQLQTPLSGGEILVERVRPQRTAERNGNYDSLYSVRNEQAVERASRMRR